MRRLARHPWMLCGSAAVLLVAACLPLWTVWHVNQWEGVGTTGNLWAVLASLPPHAERFGWLDAARWNGGCLLGMAVTVGGYLGWAAGMLRLQWRLDRGLCPSCGYDLRASPERCPECGTPATEGNA